MGEIQKQVEGTVAEIKKIESGKLKSQLSWFRILQGVFR